MGRYLLSYTACPMRRPESVILARAYLDCVNWDEVRRQCLEDDILMLRFESSRKRISSELIKRLKTLSGAELAALAHNDETAAQTALCWIAISRTYEFIRDFVEQVVATRWEQGKGNLLIGAYEAFYEEASATHPELEKLAEATRPRLRNQLFQMLREAGFIDQEFNLHAYVLPIGARDFVGIEEEPYFPTLVRSSSAS